MSVSVQELLHRVINQNYGKNCVINEVSANEIYVGFAPHGTALDSAFWKIGRVSNQSGTYKIEWAQDGITTLQYTQKTTYFSPLTLANTNSVKFDGVNDYVDFGNNYTFESSQAFSWATWCRPNNTSADRCLISKCGADANVYGYNMKHNPSGQLNIQMRAPGGLGFHTFTDLVLASLQWNHVVYTYTGNQNMSGWKCYLNGVVSAVLPSNGPITGTLANTGNLMLGNRNNFGYFVGHIDEPAVFNKALSADEVLELYNSGSPLDLNNFSAYSNILSFWRMGDGDVAPTVSDQKGSINGTLTNGAAFELVVP